LDGVSVTINRQPAAIEYVSPTQLNVLAPDNPYIGPALVQVTVTGLQGSATAQLQQAAPAFFTLGDGYAAALHADYTLVGKSGLIPGVITRPATPGETILLYGTGFGPTNPLSSAETLVQKPAPLANPVQVTIGGIVANVAFAGLVGAGLYQLNVVVPAVQDGDASVLAGMNGFASQGAVSITVQH